MSDSDWSIPAVLDVVTAAVRIARCSCGRRCGARTPRCRTAPGARGLPARRGPRRAPRAPRLQRWECGQSPIAIVLSNCPEYVETMIGPYRARAAASTSTTTTTPAEVAGAASPGRRRGDRVPPRLRPAARRGADGRGRRADRRRRRIGGRAAAPAASRTRRRSPTATVGDAARRRRPTTSTSCAPAARPARRRACCGARPTSTSRPWAASRRRTRRARWRRGAGRGPAVLVRGAAADARAAQWTVFAGLHNGGTVVLHDEPAVRRRAPSSRPPQREQVDADDDRRRRVRPPDRRRAARARPLRPVGAAALGTGGAMTSPELKHALLELLPDLDRSSTATARRRPAGMAFGASTQGRETPPSFGSQRGGGVLSEDRTAVPRARRRRDRLDGARGRVPLGYLGRPGQDRGRTFPIVDGERVAVPGDRPARRRRHRSCCSAATRWW